MDDSCRRRDPRDRGHRNPPCPPPRKRWPCRSRPAIRRPSTTTQATLQATVSVSALGGNVVWQYGTTTRYGTTSAAVATGLLGINQTLTLGVSGLAPGTTYHVRAVATSGLSTAYGRDVSFTTARVTSEPDDGSGDTSGSDSSGPGSGSSGD